MRHFWQEISKVGNTENGYTIQMTIDDREMWN